MTAEEIIRKSLAYVQEYYDMYLDALDCGAEDIAKSAYEKYLTCSLMLEEVTGKEVYATGGRVVMEDPEERQEEDEE